MKRILIIVSLLFLTLCSATGGDIKTKQMERDKIDDLQIIEMTKSTKKQYYTYLLSNDNYCDDCENYGSINSKKRFRWFDVSLKASSELKPKHSVDKIADDDFSTFWVEGKDDEGVGEWIEIRIQRKPGYSSYHLSLDNLYIFGGIGIEKYFSLNNRIKSIIVTASYKGNVVRARMLLEDEFIMHNYMLNFLSRGFFYIDTSDPFVIRFEIESVYPGSKWNDTGISELNIVGREYDPKRVP